MKTLMESIEKSDKFISFFGDGYFCTDRDNLQFCRKESETRFRYVEVDKISLYLFLNGDDISSVSNEDLVLYVGWYELLIDLNRFTDEQKSDLTSAYYGSIEQIEELYGEDSKMIIAECIFEQITQY